MKENDDMCPGAGGGEPATRGKKVCFALAVLLIVGAGSVAVRHLCFRAEPVYEIQAGTSVIRVPVPKGAKFYTPERGGGDDQAAFANMNDGKGEIIGYTLVSVDDAAYTPEQFAELVAGIRREFSQLSPLLRTEFLKQTIFQRAGIDLKQVEARQREENGALVREVEGTMTENYSPKRVSSAQVLFLLQNRSYMITVIIFAPTGSPGKAKREAWKWHGEIVAANP